jgi:hypothetical protein
MLNKEILDNFVVTDVDLDQTHEGVNVAVTIAHDYLDLEVVETTLARFDELNKLTPTGVEDKISRTIASTTFKAVLAVLHKLSEHSYDPEKKKWFVTTKQYEQSDDWDWLYYTRG